MVGARFGGGWGEIGGSSVWWLESPSASADCSRMAKGCCLAAEKQQKGFPFLGLSTHKLRKRTMVEKNGESPSNAPVNPGRCRCQNSWPAPLHLVLQVFAPQLAQPPILGTVLGDLASGEGEAKPQRSRDLAFHFHQWQALHAALQSFQGQRVLTSQLAKHIGGDVHWLALHLGRHGKLTLRLDGWGSLSWTGWLGLPAAANAARKASYLGCHGHIVFAACVPHKPAPLAAAKRAVGHSHA